MNQITGERSKKKRIKKGQTSTKWENRRATAEDKRASANQKRKYTESIQEEQQNKHYFTQQVRREAKD